MRQTTIEQRRHLHRLARAVIARHYRRPLTVVAVARALSISPRQLQRAYSSCGGSFSEDLLAVRMSVAARLLIEQPYIAVADVGRLVGYGRNTHFARAFRRRYGVPPAAFRRRARAAREALGPGACEAARPVGRGSGKTARPPAREALGPGACEAARPVGCDPARSVPQVWPAERTCARVMLRMDERDAPHTSKPAALERAAGP